MSNTATVQSAKSSSEGADGPATEPLPITRDDRGWSEDQIRTRAYELYLGRNGEPGDAVEDWLRAEREYIEPQSR